MPKRIIINAGGAFEYGGGCVDQNKGVFKLATNPSLTEAIIASLFSNIFKDGDPKKLQDGFKSGGEGIIVSITDDDKNKLEKANETLKKLRDESSEKLGITFAKKKLIKDQAKKLSGYCLSQNINDIGVITVAAPNFTPGSSANEYFNATRQKYDEWEPKEVEEYFRQMLQNICDKIIEQIKATT